TVKAITVMPWQRRDARSVQCRDLQVGETAGADARDNIIERDAQLSDARLDRRLPDRCRADENFIRAHDIGPRLAGEPTRVGQVPEKYLRVEEQPHAPPSNASSVSGGSGASKSAAILILPFRKPGLRTRLAGAIGTSFATGFPALAMTISAPSATRSTRRDRFVLASCILTCALSFIYRSV